MFGVSQSLNVHKDRSAELPEVGVCVFFVIKVMNVILYYTVIFTAIRTTYSKLY
jgi:hypothetical protein